MFTPAFTLTISLAIALCRPVLALPIADAAVDAKITSDACRIANVDYADPFDALARFDRGELDADTDQSHESFRQLLQSCCNARTSDITNSASATASRIIGSPFPSLVPTVDVSGATVLVSSTSLPQITASMKLPMGLPQTGPLPSATVSRLKTIVAPSMLAAASTLAIPAVHVPGLAPAATSSYYASASQSVSVSAATLVALPLGEMGQTHGSPLAAASLLPSGLATGSLSTSASPSAPTPKLKLALPTGGLATGLHISAAASSADEGSTLAMTTPSSASISVSATALPSSAVDLATLVNDVVSGSNSASPVPSTTSTLVASSLLSALQSTGKSSYARPTALGLANIGRPRPRPSTVSTAEMASTSASAAETASVDASASASGFATASVSQSVAPVATSVVVPTLITPASVSSVAASTFLPQSLVQAPSSTPASSLGLGQVTASAGSSPSPIVLHQSTTTEVSVLPAASASTDGLAGTRVSTTSATNTMPALISVPSSSPETAPASSSDDSFDILGFATPTSSDILVASRTSAPTSTPTAPASSGAAPSSTPCNCDIEESQDVPVNDV